MCVSRRSYRWVALLLLVGVSSPGWSYTLISGNLSGNLHWTVGGSPYRLVGNTTLAPDASLQIDPGVRVVAWGNYTFTFQGDLNLAASPTVPVVFTARPGSPAGSWGGVYFAPGSTAEVTGAYFSLALNNVVINGGQVAFASTQFLDASQDGVVVYGDAQFGAQDCLFAQNGRRGLYVETLSPQGSVTNSTFARNGEYPIHIKANCVDMLGSGLRFYGNTYEQIGVSCSVSTDLVRSQTWHSQPLPLNLTVGSSDVLVIPADVTLTLRAPLNLICYRFNIAGALQAGDGSPPDISMIGPAPVPGSWQGLHLSPAASAELYHTRVKYATTAITCDEASLSLQDCRLAFSQDDGINAVGNCQITVERSRLLYNGRYGLRLAGPAAGGITNSRFLGNGDYPVFALARNVALLGDGNSYQGNARQAIGVACDSEPDLPVSALWHNQGIPCDLTARPVGTVLSIGGSALLALQPGVTLLGGGVDVHGRLEALATVGRPIQFLPAAGSTPGSWAGICFYPGASGRLYNCVVEYAETGVLAQDCSPRLEHCRIQQCSVAGLSFRGSGTALVANCQITDNPGDAVRVSGAAQPRLGEVGNSDPKDDGNNALYNNVGYDVRNESSADLQAQNNWWNSNNENDIHLRILDGRDVSGYGLVTITPLISPGANPVPALNWTGEEGCLYDGVRPNSGLPGQTFDFRVKYSDPLGEEPRYVRVHLQDGDYPYPGSPFLMSIAAGSNYVTGVIYDKQLPLPAGRQYSYRFEAADGLQLAPGPPTSPQQNPVVNTTPTLTWTGESGFVSDGVDPEAAAPGSTFTYRIQYTDADGDQPAVIRLHVLRNDLPFPGSPFAMVQQSGEPAGGSLYQQQLVLGAATYQYRFEASDGVASASGEPTAWQNGPTIGSPSSACLGLVSAQQAPGGNVEIRCRLLQPASLSLRVRNIAGRPVAMVLAEEPCGVGERVILWSRRGDRGTRLPPGLYLLEVTARSPQGDSVRRLMPVPLR